MTVDLDALMVNADWTKTTPDVFDFKTKTVVKYTEDQPRDEHGRFGSGGGESSGGSLVNTESDRMVDPWYTDDVGVAMNAWLKENATPLNTTQQEREALSRYTSTTYLPINRSLRLGERSASRAMPGEFARHDIKGDIANIDRLMASSTLNKDVTVYRVGLAIDAKHDYPQKEDFPVGARFQDKGFTSTSLKEDVPRMYSKGPIFQIEVPAGTHAVSALTARPSSTDPQAELILNRGSSFEVVGHSESNGTPVIRVRISK